MENHKFRGYHAPYVHRNQFVPFRKNKKFMNWDVVDIFRGTDTENRQATMLTPPKLILGEQEAKMVKKEFKGLIRETEAAARIVFCNCFIDIFMNKNMLERAHDLLYLGTLYGLYPGLHIKRADSWCLDLRTLSVGAAQTVLEEWLRTLSIWIQVNDHNTSKKKC